MFFSSASKCKWRNDCTMTLQSSFQLEGAFTHELKYGESLSLPETALQCRGKIKFQNDKLQIKY
jgi:hypothetical protein